MLHASSSFCMYYIFFINFPYYSIPHERCVDGVEREIISKRERERVKRRQQTAKWSESTNKLYTFFFEVSMDFLTIQHPNS